MFFSVKQLIKIGNKIYKPCICYRVTPVLKTTVEELAKTGKAVKHEELVFFQNGKIIEKAKGKDASASLPGGKAKKAGKTEDKTEDKIEAKTGDKTLVGLSVKEGTEEF